MDIPPSSQYESAQDAAGVGHGKKHQYGDARDKPLTEGAAKFMHEKFVNSEKKGKDKEEAEGDTTRLWSIICRYRKFMPNLEHNLKITNRSTAGQMKIEIRSIKDQTFIPTVFNNLKMGAGLGCELWEHFATTFFNPTPWEPKGFGKLGQDVINKHGMMDAEILEITIENADLFDVGPVPRLIFKFLMLLKMNDQLNKGQISKEQLEAQITPEVKGKYKEL